MTLHCTAASPNDSRNPPLVSKSVSEEWEVLMGDVLLIVHILAAATWLGAGITVGFLTPRLRGAGNETAGAFMAAYERMGLVVFNPAGILVLLSGVVLVIDGPWEFENAFVVIGSAVVVIGAVLGARVFTPPGTVLVSTGSMPAFAPSGPSIRPSLRWCSSSALECIPELSRPNDRNLSLLLSDLWIDREYLGEVTG
jgi:hypothetical protein